MGWCGQHIVADMWCLQYSRSEVVLTFFERSPLDQVLRNDNVYKIQPCFQSPVKISGKPYLQSSLSDSQRSGLVLYIENWCSALPLWFCRDHEIQWILPGKHWEHCVRSESASWWRPASWWRLPPLHRPSTASVSLPCLFIYWLLHFLLVSLIMLLFYAVMPSVPLCCMVMTQSCLCREQDDSLYWLAVRGMLTAGSHAYSPAIPALPGMPAPPWIQEVPQRKQQE